MSLGLLSSPSARCPHCVRGAQHCRSTSAAPGGPRERSEGDTATWHRERSSEGPGDSLDQMWSNREGPARLCSMEKQGNGFKMTEDLTRQMRQCSDGTRPCIQDWRDTGDWACPVGAGSSKETAGMAPKAEKRSGPMSRPLPSSPQQCLPGQRQGLQESVPLQKIAKSGKARVRSEDEAAWCPSHKAHSRYRAARLYSRSPGPPAVAWLGPLWPRCCHSC